MLLPFWRYFDFHVLSSFTFSADFRVDKPSQLLRLIPGCFDLNDEVKRYRIGQCVQKVKVVQIHIHQGQFLKVYKLPNSVNE